MGKLTVYATNVLADYTTTACKDMLEESGYCDDAKCGVDITSTPGRIPRHSNWYSLTDDIREFINKFSDHSTVLNLLLEKANIKENGWFSAANSLLYLCQNLYKSIDTVRTKNYSWDYLIIYFPEAYLDDFWIRILWNLFCNVVKRTDLNLYIYTHLDYYKIENMNNEEDMEPTINLTTRLYLDEPKKTGLIDSIIDWICRKIKI